MGSLLHPEDRWDEWSASFFYYFVKFGEMKCPNSAQIAARCKGVMKRNWVRSLLS